LKDTFSIGARQADSEKIFLNFKILLGFCPSVPYSFVPNPKFSSFLRVLQCQRNRIGPLASQSGKRYWNAPFDSCATATRLSRLTTLPPLQTARQAFFLPFFRRIRRRDPV
jgi:hypothetical protein